jgi:prevent-host-death family protein
MARAIPLVVPALTARTQFGQILKRVRQNKERFVVGRRGEPQAVIMSIEEYLRHFVKRTNAIHVIRRAAQSKGLESLPLRSINAEIKRYRRENRRKNA